MNFEASPQNNEIELNAVYIMEKGKTILHEGLLRINQGDEAYIGALASCFGLVIPLEKNGAILAHIPNENQKKFKEYFTQLSEYLKNIDLSELKKTILLYKDDDLQKKKLEPIIKILEKCGVTNLRKLGYTQDNTAVKVDTLNNQITVAPLDLKDLTTKKGITPYTENY
jgi:hypothetical protein